MFRHLPALALAIAQLLTLSVASAATSPQSSPLSPSLSPSPRIIGGVDAGAGDFPFMAALVYSPAIGAIYSNDYQAQFCGGTIIAARWVLTAAHCVVDEQASSIQVIAGVTTLAQSPPFAVRTNVQHILVHPQYDSSDDLANDLALLYLTSPLTVSSGFSIDDGGTLLSLGEGADLTIAGWGVTYQGVIGNPDDDEFSSTLQRATVDYIPFSRCNSLYYAGTLQPNVLCATWLSGTPRDTCFGDSGGPLLYAQGGGSWRQLGITSFGASSTCALNTEPGLYTNVSNYAGFITGAQTQPDLAVNVWNVIGTDLLVRASAINLSPVNTSTGTTMTITLTGNMTLNNAASLTGCSHTRNGAGTTTTTVIACALGTLASGASQVRELDIKRSGAGPFSVNARVNSSSGDYFRNNNSITRQFPLAGLNQSGGPTAPTLLLTMLLLAYRRQRKGIN